MDIDALVTGWGRAWNAHDMEAAAALVDDAVDFVTVAGRWLCGRAEFLDHHAAIHREHLRRSVWITHAHAARPLRDDLALVHLEWTIAGECDPAGRERERAGIFTWVVGPGPVTPLILAAHNTNLRADTKHRLPRR